MSGLVIYLITYYLSGRLYRSTYVTTIPNGKSIATQCVYFKIGGLINSAIFSRLSDYAGATQNLYS